MLIDGRMIHCHPHVPSSPPEPEKSLGKESTSIKPVKENQEVKKTTPKSNIPGLPEEEIGKAQKKKKQKEKKQKEKEKLKDIENKKAEANLLSSNSPGKAFLSSTQNSGSELEIGVGESQSF